MRLLFSSCKILYSLLSVLFILSGPYMSAHLRLILRFQGGEGPPSNRQRGGELGGDVGGARVGSAAHEAVAALPDEAVEARSGRRRRVVPPPHLPRQEIVRPPLPSFPLFLPHVFPLCRLSCHSLYHSLLLFIFRGNFPSKCHSPP